jgi:hypothetical protein
MKLLMVFLFCAGSFSLCAAEKVQVVPVVQSAEPTMAGMDIVFPDNGGRYESNPIDIQLRIKGFLLGAKTSTSRANELVNDRLGQYVNVIVDDNAVFTSRGPAISPLHDEGDYYQEFYKFAVPFDLQEGRHTMRFFLVKSYGESLKTKKSFAAVEFYLKNNKEDRGINLKEPYISYNQPSANIKYRQEGPVLLDFYLSNCRLSSGGYRVKLYVDKKKVAVLEKWNPYYLYGLSKGKHTIKLVLIDKHGMKVSGKNSSVKGSFLVF